jgi:hypothetical protein
MEGPQRLYRHPPGLQPVDESTGYVSGQGSAGCHSVGLAEALLAVPSCDRVGRRVPEIFVHADSYSNADALQGTCKTAVESGRGCGLI